MAINLFSDYGGFYTNHKFNSIPKVDVETVKAQDEKKLLDEQKLPEIPVVPEVKASEPVVDNRSRNVDLDNISLTFNKGDDYSYIGSDFEIGSLDLEQAISDMRKDKVLEDYQFFVGTSSEAGPIDAASLSTEDGKVFLK